jgi:hypothetical protein
MFDEIFSIQLTDIFIFLTLMVEGVVVMIQSFKVTGSLGEAISGCVVFLQRSSHFK